MVCIYALGAELSVSFVAFGDMGVSAGNGATSTTLRIAAEMDAHNFLLHFGDIR